MAPCPWFFPSACAYFRTHKTLRMLAKQTFLVLAHRRRRRSERSAWLSSWLHGVAYRVATNLRVERNRRRKREAAVRGAAKTDSAELRWQEIQAVLDEELMQLPESLRAPLLLCLLEGKTRDEAAQELGWSLATLRGRFERGRKRLQARLVQRGLTLSVALLGVFVLAKSSAAAMSPALLNSTAQAALFVAAGKPMAGVISSQVAVLMKGALKSMFVTKLKIVGLIMLAVSILGIGAGLFIHRAVANDQPEAFLPRRSPIWMVPRLWCWTSPTTRSPKRARTPSRREMRRRLASRWKACSKKSTPKRAMSRGAT